MIFINKSSEPQELAAYKEKMENVGYVLRYEDLQNPEKETVLKSLIAEQGGLCAYCMCRIPEKENGKGAYIEHIVPKSKNRNLDLEYRNMLAVCSGNRSMKNNRDKSCDASRGDKDLTLNPCKADTLANIYYSNDGSIHSSNSKEEEELNDVLHLNSARDLVHLRRSALDALFQYIEKENIVSNKKKYEEQLKKIEDEKIEKMQYAGILIWWLKSEINKLARIV